MGVKIQVNKIYLPKLGWMRFYNSRPIPKVFTIKVCTVRKRQDGWHISLRVEDKSVPEYRARPLEQVTKIIRCDLGITKLVHLSDGYQIENPKFSNALRIPVDASAGSVNILCPLERLPSNRLFYGK
jgi:putative transposase